MNTVSFLKRTALECFFFFGSLGHVGDCYIKLSSFVMFSNSLKLSCNVEINIQALAEFSTMTGLH